MILVAIIFILCGILIKHGKMYFLIAGYNTLPKEEKENYNIEAIALIFRNVMFGMAIFIILGVFLSEVTQIPEIQEYTFWSSIIVGIPYLLIETNSKKYKERD